MMRGVDGRRQAAARERTYQTGGGSLAVLRELKAFAAAGVDKKLKLFKRLKLHFVDNIVEADVVFI